MTLSPTKMAFLSGAAAGAGLILSMSFAKVIMDISAATPESLNSNAFPMLLISFISGPTLAFASGGVFSRSMRKLDPVTVGIGGVSGFYISPLIFNFIN